MSVRTAEGMYSVRMSWMRKKTKSPLSMLEAYAWRSYLRGHLLTPSPMPRKVKLCVIRSGSGISSLE